MNEEERAELFREQYAARRQARCERFEGLAGDSEARTALDLAWRPYLLARLEAEAEIDPDLYDDLICEVPGRSSA